MLKFANVDEYIRSYPKETQKLLRQVRETIHKAEPKADEVISYGMPAFKLNKILVYFAGCKNHIGFYPTPSAIEAFKTELSVYQGAKGSVQFPFDKPLPLGLIRKMTQFRAAEDAEKAKIKKK